MAALWANTLCYKWAHCFTCNVQIWQKGHVIFLGDENECLIIKHGMALKSDRHSGTRKRMCSARENSPSHRLPFPFSFTKQPWTLKLQRLAPAWKTAWPFHLVGVLQHGMVQSFPPCVQPQFTLVKKTCSWVGWMISFWSSRLWTRGGFPRGDGTRVLWAAASFNWWQTMYFICALMQASIKSTDSTGRGGPQAGSARMGFR